MTRKKSALLWGIVGALSFMVLHQAYLLVGGEFLGFGPVSAVTLGVFGAAAASTYLLEGSLRRRLQGAE